MAEINYEYRTKPLYYKKYRYKVLLSSHRGIKNINWPTVKSWMEKNGYKKSSYRIAGVYDYYEVYIEDDAQYKAFFNHYQKHIVQVCLPAPGYENLYESEDNKRTLWYNKYPYKLMVRGKNLSDPDNGPIAWCYENAKSDWCKNGIVDNISFFFMNPIDAFSFKLAFGHIITETHMPDLSEARIALVDRVNKAQTELDEFDKNVKDSNLT